MGDLVKCLEQDSDQVLPTFEDTIADMDSSSLTGDLTETFGADDTLLGHDSAIFDEVFSGDETPIEDGLVPTADSVADEIVADEIFTASETVIENGVFSGDETLVEGTTVLGNRGDAVKHQHRG